MILTLQEMIRSQIDSFIPQGPLFDLIRYHLEGGKMIRPILCLSTYQALGGKIETILPAACALELLHNFTLIHDDIEDGSEVRRGKPALWKICGEAQAINAADALFALSHLCLLKLTERGVEQEKVYKLSHLFNRTCLRICQAQHLDLSWEKQEQISQEDYFSLASEKTGALFECALLVSAMLADAQSGVLNSLRQCGYFLGLGFQIQDDVFGLQEEKAISEIKRGKKTFPLILLIESKPEVLKLYHRGGLNNEEAKVILNLLRGEDISENALKVAQGFYQDALNALKKACLPQPDELEGIILSLERRAK